MSNAKSNARVTGVRSIELGVRDLDESLKFYSDTWGLEVASSDGDAIYLRGTGTEHHILALRQTGKPALLGVDFSAADSAAVDALSEKAKGYGVDVKAPPAQRAATAGGGYGFGFVTPDGLPMSISADVQHHASANLDRSKPTKISHVVLNSAATDGQTAFFIDALGFKLTDSSHLMEFLRCCADHHSIAIFRNQGPSLNHMAYEVPNIDGLMRGAGRMKQGGYDVEWGLGRHGPGNNVFSYFIEPNGFVTEYTTEISQVDEGSHVNKDADYWQKVAPLPDIWGTAGLPTNKIRHAMSGALAAEIGERCEDIIARKRA